MPHATFLEELDLTTMASADNNLATAKILMLHGHAESGPVFQTKTRRLATQLRAAFPPFPSPDSHPLYPGGAELFYPTGPLRITPCDLTQTGDDVDVDSNAKQQDLDAWAWGNGDFRAADPIEGLVLSVPYMLEYMETHGPFVGVIGFSCGATLAAMLASILDGERSMSMKNFAVPDNISHPPLHFAVCYSGFMLKCPLYKPLYSPKIRTPIIHIIGKYDPMTEEASTLGLVKRCRNAEVVYHPGSHYVPTKTLFLERVVGFVEGCMGAAGSGSSAGEEEEELWVDI